MNAHDVEALLKEKRSDNRRAKQLRLMVRGIFRLAVDREMAAHQYQNELEKKIAVVEARHKESKKAVKVINKMRDSP